MGFLEVTVGTASILTRVLSYLGLRWIPGHNINYVYYLFFLQVIGLLIIQGKLAVIEAEPGRTIEVEQERFQKEGGVKQIEGVGSNGTPSKKKHKKKNSQAQAQSQGGQGHQKKPSYADMAAKGTPAEHHNDDEEDAEDNADGIVAHGKATKRPPTSYLTKNIAIPSRPNPLHLLFGLPSSSRSFNWLSLLINALLVVMCLDFQFTPKYFKNVHDSTFIRVGDVTDTTAKLVARLPPSLFEAKDSFFHRHSNHSIFSGGHSTPVHGANLVYRPTKPIGPWHFGGLFTPEIETDYVGSLKLFSLLPSTEYEFGLVFPDKVSHRFNPPTVENPQYFKTAPDPRLAIGNTHFKFSASSCIRPNFPYVRGQDHLKIKGAEDLADRISPDNIDFLMFMGDFIYADVPAKSTSQAAVTKHYRQTYASAEYRRIYEKIPTYHIWDDHDTAKNNAAFGGNESDPHFQLSNPAYQNYIAAGNPDSIVEGGSYYTFRRGDAAFFVLDTRRYRSSNEAVDDEEKTMLGQEQKDHLFEWLSQVNGTSTFKFIVSSVPMHSLYGGPDGQTDTWAGFMHERAEILDVMEYVPNVIVLSGDRHEFSAVIMREKVLDLCIGPLNQFWLPIKTLSQKYGAGATGEDRLLKYIPNGNRKYATLEVDTRTANQPVVNMKLYIDGEETYNLTINGQPIHRPIQQPGKGLGKSLALSLSELLGLGRSWF